MDKELKVKKIRDGTVIDHLNAGTALTVLKIIGLPKTTIAIAMNVPSKKKGKKDVVKVENKFLDIEELNKIAVISPNATINIIKNYEVIEKRKVSLPDRISQIIKCANPTCISNIDEDAIPEFKVESRDPLKLRCIYCERILYGEDVKDVL